MNKRVRFIGWWLVATACGVVQFYIAAKIPERLDLAHASMLQQAIVAIMVLNTSLTSVLVAGFPALMKTWKKIHWRGIARVVKLIELNEVPFLLWAIASPILMVMGSLAGLQFLGNLQHLLPIAIICALVSLLEIYRTRKHI